MNKINYQKELDKIIENLKSSKTRPKLLMHSCCAPCSSYCLIYMKDYFDITSVFYNPNITDANEYEKRRLELKRLIWTLNNDMDVNGSSDGADEPLPIQLIDAGFEEKLFFQKVKGLENEPEGGKRCVECFALRLYKAAKMASEGGYDYFTTTLTISPLKDEQLINRLGYEAGAKYGVKWLPCDFKKKGGYLESVRLSEKYGLYRQDYCGCIYSLRRDLVLKK